MSEYTTVAGTEPDMDEQHEARMIERRTGGELYMMSEIGDGRFVQWGDCYRCHDRVATCPCPGGPKEPPYIEKWRTERFIDSFKGRGVEPALPVVMKTQNRRIDAVLRLLRSKGWTLTNPKNDTLAPTQLVIDDLAAKQELVTNTLAGDQPNEVGNIPIGQTEEETPEPEVADDWCGICGEGIHKEEPGPDGRWTHDAVGEEDHEAVPDDMDQPAPEVPDARPDLNRFKEDTTDVGF